MLTRATAARPSGACGRVTFCLSPRCLLRGAPQGTMWQTTLGATVIEPQPRVPPALPTEMKEGDITPSAPGSHPDAFRRVWRAHGRCALALMTLEWGVVFGFVQCEHPGTPPFGE